MPFLVGVLRVHLPELKKLSDSMEEVRPIHKEYLFILSIDAQLQSCALVVPGRGCGC